METEIKPGKEQLNQIKDGELSIHAEIRFDDEKMDQLSNVFSLITKSKSATTYLHRRDRFFKYDKERDIWHGSESVYNLPYLSI